MLGLKLNHVSKRGQWACWPPDAAGVPQGYSSTDPTGPGGVHGGYVGDDTCLLHAPIHPTDARWGCSQGSVQAGPFLVMSCCCRLVTKIKVLKYCLANGTKVSRKMFRDTKPLTFLITSTKGWFGYPPTHTHTHTHTHSHTHTHTTTTTSTTHIHTHLFRPYLCRPIPQRNAQGVCGGIVTVQQAPRIVHNLISLALRESMAHQFRNMWFGWDDLNFQGCIKVGTSMISFYEFFCLTGYNQYRYFSLSQISK